MQRIKLQDLEFKLSRAGREQIRELLLIDKESYEMKYPGKHLIENWAFWKQTLVAVWKKK